jgi:replicative DNA helicase
MTNGWQNQDYIVIGARPSTGKTAGMLNSATAALRAGKKVGIFSAEMNTRSILLRMVSDWGNIDSKKLRSGFMGSTDALQVGETAQQIGKTGLFINDTPNISFQALVSDARRMVRKEKVEIIFIDYMGLIVNEKNNLKRHEQVSEISRNLKGLARELNIPIVVLSQLTRESHGSKPTIADLRESGSIEQDADLIILLQDLGYTDDSETCKKIKWIVGKQRNGQTGDISMIFKGAYMRMKESEEKWQEPEKRKTWTK